MAAMNIGDKFTDVSTAQTQDGSSASGQNLALGAVQHNQPPAYTSSNPLHAGYDQDASFPSVQYQIPAQTVTQQPAPIHNTTVIMQQQAPQPQPQPPRDWNTGVCQCCDDIGTCLMVCFCGECYACCFMDKVKESACFPCCFPGSWMGAVRTKIRTKYHIEGTMMNDFCLTGGCCCCFTRPCVFCQMVREVNRMENLGNPI